MVLRFVTCVFWNVFDSILQYETTETHLTCANKKAVLSQRNRVMRRVIYAPYSTWYFWMIPSEQPPWCFVSL